MYIFYHRRFMKGYPQPQVFSATPIGLASSRSALEYSAKIPEYRDTEISWLGGIAKSIDKSNNLTNRIFCCIIFTLAKQEVKKMKLKKVGNMKINVFDILEFYGFLKKYAFLDLNYFYTYMEKVLRNKGIWIHIKVKPKLILLPKYRYSQVSERLRKVANIKKDESDVEVIKLENLSSYRIFEVQSSKKCEADEVLMSVGFISSSPDRKAIIDDLALEIDTCGNNIFASVGFSVSYWNDDIEDLQDALITLKKVVNKNYASAVEEDSEIPYKIARIENKIWVVLNFFYILYTGNYVRDKYSAILDPIVDTLRNLGNTFEEMLESAKMLYIFTR